jgi:hypothetical protein
MAFSHLTELLYDIPDLDPIILLSLILVSLPFDTAIFFLSYDISRCMIY